MQQTEKYKLNLIEPSDPFLPDALNANTQKVEDVLKETLVPMDQRVTILEGHHFACGTYVGEAKDADRNKEQFIPLPFAPKAVMIFLPGIQPNIFVLAIEDQLSKSPYLRLEENGFTAIAPQRLNTYNYTYNYLAFA